MYVLMLLLLLRRELLRAEFVNELDFIAHTRLR
jgi:hypothetical protein